MKSSINILELNQIVLDYCLQYNITILPKRFKSAVGRAWVESKTIKIPHIIDIETFMVSLHEIGHIVRSEVSEPLYLCEFEADKWAIETAKKHGIDCGNYIYRSRWYILSFISELHNTGVKYKVPKEVLKHVKEDISQWKQFSNIEVYYDKKTLTIIKTI